MAEAEDVPAVLLPCAICARTFRPDSLEKHTRICERAAIKKRKPFDSAKQRIQGTELAEFLPKQERKRNVQEDRSCKPRTSWKETHTEFLQTIRAARGEPVEVSIQRQLAPAVSTGAPTRANEKGMCPTCNRLFGIKAYDRHVAWCKERAIRLPISPATNIAKERLEARMKYRAPALKNRRPTNREKYSLGSACNLSLVKSSPSSVLKAKESASAPNCSKGEDGLVNSKSNLRRLGQRRDHSVVSGAAKLRLEEQSNRPMEARESGSSTSQSLRPTPQRRSYLPVLPSKSVKAKNVFSSPSHSKYEGRRYEAKYDVVCQRERISEQKVQIDLSARSQRGNPNSGRVRDNPRVNGTDVNDEVVGMIVQPCSMIHQDHQVVTWKQIGEEKNRNIERNKVLAGVVNRVDVAKGTDEFRTDEKTGIAEYRRKLAGGFAHEQSTNIGSSCLEGGNIMWTNNIQKLDQTYLIKESIETDIECADVIPVRKWRAVQNSPRIEFRLKDTGGSNVPVRWDKPYQSCCSALTNFGESVKFTSTPVSNKGDGAEVANVHDHFGEHAGWSGGLKLEESDSPKLGFLESDVESSRDNSKSCIMDSVLSKKMKKMKSLNVRRRNEDCDTSRSSRSSCKINVFPVQSASPELEDPEILGSPRKEEKSEENIESDNRFSEERLNCSETKMKETPVQSFSCSLTSKSFDRLSLEVSEYSENTVDLSRQESNRNARIDVTFSDTNRIILKEAEDTEEGEKNRESISAKAESGNYSSRSFEPSNQVNRDQMFFKNENSNYESPDESTTQRSSLTEDDKPKIEINQDQINTKLDPTIPTKDEPWQKDIADNPVKMEDNTRRRCGTYVIERPITDSIINTNHRTSNESIDDRPLQKRRKIENVKYPDIRNGESNDDPVNSSTMSKSLSRMTNEVEVAFDDETRQIYEKYININFDYDSDNAIVDHYPLKDPDTSESITCQESIVRKNSIDDLCGKTLSETYVKSKEHKLQETGKSSHTDLTDIQRRIRNKMNILRGSTDTLISSVEAVRSNEKVASSYKIEECTIEAIGCPISERSQIDLLPMIEGEMTRTRSNRKSKEQQILYWERTSKTCQSKLVTMDPPRKEFRLPKRNPKIQILPPMLCADSPSVRHSSTGRNYDPFLLAEHQMNELFSDTSEQSTTDCLPTLGRESTSPFPLSHSSAFVKYPSPASPSSNKRASVIAPPSEFDDFISDFSSDSTETNSTSQEIFINDLNSQTREAKPLPHDSLTRHVVIDRSKSLNGSGKVNSSSSGRGKTFISSAERTRKILEKVSPKIVRPTINRSQSVRASSAPKAPERKSSVNSSKKISSKGSSASSKNNDYATLSGSNLSLNSIVSSTEANIKRSNSAFDELISSLEDDGSSFPSLKSFLKNDSMSLSSPVHGSRMRNGQNSDEELSSPDSYKRQDHKLSADSAYSSLNRKYSNNHGRSTNDVASRLDEEASRRRDANTTPTKCKLPKFCHECGSKFPETAKFCCECGIKRLVL